MRQYDARNRMECVDYLPVFLRDTNINVTEQTCHLRRNDRAVRVVREAK